MKQSFKPFVWLLVLIFLISAACGGGSGGNVPGGTPQPDLGPLEIQATDEMTLLANAGIFNDFASQPGGVSVNLHTEKGSVELKLEIAAISKNNPSRVHAYITSDPFFMPGTEVRDKKPIMMSLTTLVVTRAKVQRLRWTADIRMTDVIAAARAGQLDVCSASASQDAAALNFFISALTALKGTGDTLRSGDLADTSPVVASMKDFYAAMKKGAYNSDTLRQSVFNEYKSSQLTCDAVVLPESSAIALNRDLTAIGLEPMQIFYITDATAVQIYTMGCVDKINQDKLAQCQALEKYLSSASVQAKIIGLGFRANDVGYAVPNADPTVFNPDWGVRPDEPFSVDMPKDGVVEAAINLYQVGLRPGSYTVYVLDFSPSMDGSGKQQLLTAMKMLLDQSIAARYYLQTSPKDTTYTVLFSGEILAEYVIAGDDPNQLLEMYGRIEAQPFGNSTNIYGSAMRGVELAQINASMDQLAAVILLTDGGHNYGQNYDQFEAFYQKNGYTVPVYSVMMGDAVEDELRAIADLTNGAVCDGRGGEEQLARCFRQFKGSN